MTRFPAYYPYLTKKGVLVNNGEIDQLTKDLIHKFSPRVLEFGLELSYIILWILNNVDSKEGYFPIACSLAGKLVKRKTVDEIAASRSRELDETYVDTQLIEEHDAWIYQQSFKALSKEHTVESILSLDRRERHRLVKKLKQIAEESYHAPK